MWWVVSCLLMLCVNSVVVLSVLFVIVISYCELYSGMCVDSGLMIVKFVCRLLSSVVMCVVWNIGELRCIEIVL